MLVCLSDPTTHPEHSERARAADPFTQEVEYSVGSVARGLVSNGAAPGLTHWADQDDGLQLDTLVLQKDGQQLHTGPPHMKVKLLEQQTQTHSEGTHTQTLIRTRTHTDTHIHKHS